MPTETKTPFHITELVFSSGDSITLTTKTKLIFVGPNNVGKSTALSEIAQRSRGQTTPLTVFSDIRFKLDQPNLLDWIKQRYPVLDNGNVPNTLGETADGRMLAMSTGGVPGHVSLTLAGMFLAAHFTADGRGGMLGEPDRLELDQPPSHPLQALQGDEGLQRRFSAISKRAFGFNLVLNQGGRLLKLHCGDAPPMEKGWDRITPEYVRRLNTIPRLTTQGHGVRAFLGLTINLLVAPQPLKLVDEPETHLHPPQARLLGSTIGSLTNESQTVLATHSGTFLRGILEEADGDTRVVRIRRQGGKNHARVLESSDLQILWSDPLLRHSNILDGIFHDAVIVCEADSDCRFYSSVLSAIRQQAQQEADILFVHCGGKDRMRIAAKALCALGVPLAVIADVDILADEIKLISLVQSVGGEWSEEMATLWRIIDSAVRQKLVSPPASEFRRAVKESLVSVKDSDPLPWTVVKQIADALPKKSPWVHLKASGKAGLPSGDATVAFGQLLVALSKLGIFVVELGELERFVPTIGGHGPEWVASVLESKTLATDAELESARLFVRKIKNSLEGKSDRG